MCPRWTEIHAFIPQDTTEAGKNDWQGSQVKQGNESQVVVQYLTFWFIRYLLPNSSLGISMACLPALPLYTHFLEARAYFLTPSFKYV